MAECRNIDNENNILLKIMAGKTFANCGAAFHVGSIGTDANSTTYVFMPPSGNKVGVIILGNSGAGKSFLVNVILGKECFRHEYQVDAVTLTTEFEESTFDGQTYAIYNIPGLIEAEQERIDLKIREINIAFQQHPNAVVLYVFRISSGKIRNADVVAFNAINAAYPLSEKSLVVVVNNVCPNRPDNYD